MVALKKGEEIEQVELVRWPPQETMTFASFRKVVEIQETGPVRIAKEPRKRRNSDVRNGRMSVRTSPQLHWH